MIKANLFYNMALIDSKNIKRERKSFSDVTKFAAVINVVARE